MGDLIKITDSKETICTKKYPHAKWDFENFNIVQSTLLDYYKKDINGIVAANTSAGKTVCSELFLAHEIRKRGGKGMMLVPIKALAQERYDDWTNENHHFNDLKTVVCTGDYKLSKEESLDDADLIIMTSEMLNSKSRNKKNEFIKSIKTLVIDESHLITTPGRGDHLEVGLINFCSINPDARIILLSATMPNVDEIGNWLRKLMPNKDCFILNSKYRPCPLNIHYEIYYDGNKSYDKNEMEKVYKSLDIINHYPDDKFIIFVHTKKTGENLKNHLLKEGIETEFHNANLEKAKRIALEDRFKNDPKFRVIIATSTLACGLNLPARRVIVAGVHRGLEEVETYNITQMCGRAGRPRFDKMGDAYILLPELSFEKHKEKLKKKESIESQLLKNDYGHYKVLAFHIVNEINNKSIKTNEDIHEWYKSTLCHFQSKDLNTNILDKTIESLVKRGIIYKHNDNWKTTMVGKISSMYYYPPFDAADLKSNLQTVCDSGLFDNDYLLSLFLANIDSFKSGIISKAEKEEISLFSNRLERHINDQNLKIFKTDSSMKYAACYYNILNGLNSQNMNAILRNLQIDFPRTLEVLKQIDKMDIKENVGDELEVLGLRIQNGVPKHLVNLCGIKNIGKQRAKKLFESNIKNVSDIVNTPIDKLKVLLNLKENIIKDILSDANKLLAEKTLV
jgi:helicase